MHVPSRLIRPIDAIFSVRPVLMIPVWGFSAFGYYRFKTAGRAVSFQELWAAIPGSAFMWFFVFSLSVGAVYIINQLADTEVDKKNGGLPLIASGIVSLPSALFTAAMCGVLSIAWPLVAGYYALAILSVLALLTGIVYSCRPTFFSGKPLLDFLSNAIGYGIIAFGAGWVIAGGNIADGRFLPAALPYFFLMCAGSISSTIPDMTGDGACAKRTTAVVLGKRMAHRLATVFIAAALLVSLKQHDPVSLFSAAFSLPVYLAFMLKPGRLLEETTYKAGGALCMLLAGILMPALMIWSLLVFLLTWLYFRHRHGISYPSLVPIN